MKVKIIRISDGQYAEASIAKAGLRRLPSLTDGWRFNFSKHSRKTGFHTYVLVRDERPDIIEGCLIFKLKNGAEPYMAYVEIAPHNKGHTRSFDLVAGCLVAFASRLSFIHGESDFKGWLAFDVLEESKEDQIKLMAVYCKKYGALRFGETTLVISPEAGENLINQYLK